MTYTPEEKRIYMRGYFQGYKKATIDHLGSQCTECDERDPDKLEIHHLKGCNSKSRQLELWKDLKEIRLKCKKHHSDTPNYKGRRKKVRDQEIEEIINNQ